MTSYWILSELYKLPIDILINKNLSIRIIELNEIELKYNDGFGPNGRGKATKIERFPSSINSEILIKSINDYIKLIPTQLSNTEFDSRLFARVTRQKINNSRISLLVLYRLGILDRYRNGKHGFKYRINNQFIVR